MAVDIYLYICIHIHVETGNTLTFVAEEVSLMLDTNMENGGNLTGVENGKCTTTADSGIPKSLEDRDMTYSPKKRR